MKLYFCLALMCLGVSAEYHCALVPGLLKQIDASAGQVYGVNNNDDIYRLDGNDWVQVPGKLKLGSVGPSGVWGVNGQNKIFKRQDENWVQVAGCLKQLVASGRVYLVGVNSIDEIFCLNTDDTLSKDSNSQFLQMDGALKYLTCGLDGCWGANSNNDIFYRTNVTSENYRGSEWKHVEGKMVMVQAGTDRSVHGINTAGNICKREGICDSNPIGTYWSLVDIKGSYKHVSYDGGIMWLINQEGNIFKCKYSYNQPALTSSGPA